MSASSSDKFKLASNGTRPSPTTLTALKAIGASSISVGALTGWPTTTGVDFCIYTIDTSGNKVAGSQTDWSGTASGTTISNLTLRAGTDNGYAVGAIVEAGPVAAWADDVTSGISVEHKQTGLHSDIHADTLAVSGATTLTGALTGSTASFTSVSISGTSTSQGWTALGQTPNTVTANSSVPKVFDLVFNGDLTGTLSNGMKLQCARTVAAPSQCTDLELGSSQYWSKSSPAGLSFTTTFTCSAWIKLESYGTQMGIIARRNASTEGFSMALNSSGQLLLAALRIAGNNKVGTSYASVPLNKWVHVAATMDVSVAGDASTNMYFDGILVASSVTTTGTCTALVQGTTALVVGAEQSDGTNKFDGKIAQAAVYSAVLSASTIRDSINRTLSGSETNLVSAYSFNNTSNDLNANANNLTAQNSAVATNADSPFANGVSAGSLEYAEVLNVAFSTNTTVTVRVPDGCQIPTSGGISSVLYSTQSNPYGLPFFSKILSSAIVMTNAQTNSTSITALLGLTASTYVPANTRLKVTLFGKDLYNDTAAKASQVSICDGTVVAGSIIQSASVVSGGGNMFAPLVVIAYPINSTAGVKTYAGGWSVSAASNGTIDAGSTYPLTIVIELV